MKKVLVVGASGALGFEVLQKLSRQNVPLRALVLSEDFIPKVNTYTKEIFVADATDPHQLKGVCQGVDVVFSALGKSLSLFKVDTSEYEEVDFNGNQNILTEALKSGVKRFVYTSIKGSETASHLEIAKVHKQVQELLEDAQLSHTIIKPVGLFAGLNDMLILAKRGIIPVPGDGEARTNPIHHSDLADVIVENMFQGPEKLEAGGPVIHTRNELAEMVKKITGARIVHLPELMIKTGLIPVELVKKSVAENLDYFRYVTTNDMIAPQFGTITFEEYLNRIDLDTLP